MPLKFDAARFTAEEALLFHSQGKPGKLEITPTKPLTTQRDLSLAYSPGVAVPVLAIAQDPSLAYDYTNKGNLVAVVSNGTAILGLGNLGALAAKPVMEGKGALFKRFADIDGIDLLVDTADVDAFINCVRYLGPSFGGINLEDIKAPDCFIIEEKLKELLNIPVFHDDQHGTAIIAAAGLINALELTGRDIKNFKLVVNGAGAASIACMDLLAAMGMPKKNMLLCDTKGVIYRGRKEGMNQWKSAFAVETKARDAGRCAERRRCLLRSVGRRHGDARTWCARWPTSRSSSPWPIPIPEITPEEVAEVRSDAIVATGRSDYPEPDQQRAGLPLHLPRRARRAGLDHQRGDEDRRRQGAGRAGARGRARPGRGRVPRPAGDLRARLHHPGAVRSAAHHACAAGRRQGGHGDGRGAQADRRHGWLRRPALGAGSIRSPAGSAASSPRCATAPKRIIFAEGEQPQIARAANSFHNMGLGQPVLIGRLPIIKEAFASAGIEFTDAIETHDTSGDDRRHEYAEFLYSRLQRKGYLLRDCQRLVNNDRNVYGACMVAHGPRRRHGHRRHAQLVHGLRRRAQGAGFQRRAGA